MRDSVIIYRSFYEAIKEIPNENQAEVWRSIFEYSLNSVDPILTGISKTVFTLIKPQIDANIKRRERGKENGYKGAEFGKLGGKPAKQETPSLPVAEPLTNPQVTPSEPSNVNANGNVKENPKPPKKQSVFVVPTKQEVMDYFVLNSFSPQRGATAFEYYDAADWHDKNGDKVRSWKQKMISVWFEEKYKIKVDKPETLEERAKRLAKEDAGG